MILKHLTRAELIDYVTAQLGHLIPDGKDDPRSAVESSIDEALARLEHCIGGVRMWRPGEFDHLHSSQYTIFLYYLANTAWRNLRADRVCTKLFYLNKALNGFECFYDTELPEIFFIGHTVGIVLARTTYSNYFAIYQNSTVGKSHGEAPVLGEGVVMYPNTAILGKSRIGPRSYIAQGASVVNKDTPGNCIVFENARKLTFRTPDHDILADIFRI
jgi:serine O-acetyltransferase